MAIDFTAFVPSLIAGGASILGNVFASRGNRQAADIAANTAATNAAGIRATNARAGQILQPIAANAQPGLDYMRRTVATNPYQLSTRQQIELKDRSRQAVTMIPSSLRGSGRYTSAMANDVLNRGRAGMIAENQGRADVAARGLASTGAAATTNQASITAGQGPQIATQNTMAGDVAGNAATQGGENTANVISQIGSFFANALKDQQRESKYGDFRAAA